MTTPHQLSITPVTEFERTQQQHRAAFAFAAREAAALWSDDEDDQWEARHFYEGAHCMALRLGVPDLERPSDWERRIAREYAEAMALDEDWKKLCIGAPGSIEAAVQAACEAR